MHEVGATVIPFVTLFHLIFVIDEDGDGTIGVEAVATRSTNRGDGLSSPGRQADYERIDLYALSGIESGSHVKRVGTRRTHIGNGEGDGGNASTTAPRARDPEAVEVDGLHDQIRTAHIIIIVGTKVVAGGKEDRGEQK